MVRKDWADSGAGYGSVLSTSAGLVVFTTVLGAGLVFAALRDVFHQLFHPSGNGSISRVLMRTTWRAFRRAAGRTPKRLEHAGPAALLVVVANWVVLTAVGWALILWPHLPQRFVFASGLVPSDQDGIVDALYLSLVTLATLGYGDIAPRSDSLRLLLPLEALVGFALLTASLTWVVSVYPPLTRRRSLAQQIALVRDAESETGVAVARAGAEASERRLGSLASQLTVIRSDLCHFPITYYFHAGDERSSLSANMGGLLRIAQDGVDEGNPPPVRLSAAELRGAIDDFSATIASQFLDLPSAPTAKVLAAYARDHLRASPEDDGLGQGADAS
jgi:hypothetical protein